MGYHRHIRAGVSGPQPEGETMTEFLVQFRRLPGCMRVEATSQEEAEAIARKDGHDIKPKAEVDAENLKYAKEKQAKDVEHLQAIVDTAKVDDANLSFILDSLGKLKTYQNLRVFSFVGEETLEGHLKAEYTESVKAAIKCLATALGALRVARSAAQNKLDHMKGLGADEYLDHYGD